jgi:probable phosphoglycerate mutase
VWNEEKRLQGRKDSPLTENGKKNAAALRAHLKGEHFDAIYASPIKRAYDTAKLVFPDSPIIKDERIMEMNFGICEGMYLDHFDPSLKEVYSELWEHPETSKGLPEGESYDEIEERVRDFLKEITHKNYDKVFVVTHGFCFTILVSLMLGLERKEYPKINKKIVNGCSLTIFDYQDGKYTMELYGDNSFLPVKTKDVFAR